MAISKAAPTSSQALRDPAAVERVARALAAKRHQPQFDQGNSSLLGVQYADKYWRDYVGDARAAIEAIRELD